MRHPKLGLPGAAMLSLIGLLLVTAASTGSAHAQGATTSAATSGACDQFDSWCAYCMNNTTSDLCAPGAAASMTAPPTPSMTVPVSGTVASIATGESVA